MKISTTLGICVSIATLAGGVVAFDTHYAKTAEVKDLSEYVCAVEKRLDQKIKNDRINNVQERIWRLEDRYGKEEAEKMDEYRRLKKEKEDLLRNMRK
jgi:hypothetical protein